MPRILILGLPGSGKSTLAKQLSAKLGIPLIEADRYFWKTKKVPADSVEFLRQIDSLTTLQSEWIFEGHFKLVRPLIQSKVQTVLVLDYPYAITLYRWTKRALLRRDFSGWLWILTQHRKLRRLYENACETLAIQGTQIIRLQKNKPIHEIASLL